MNKYQQTVEAVQLNYSNRDEIIAWSGGQLRASKPWKSYSTGIDLPGGDYAWVGCWVVRNADGVFTMMEDAEFRRLFTGATPEAASNHGVSDDWYPPAVEYPEGHGPTCRRSCTHPCHEPYDEWKRRQP